jgi:hypothetical protein
LAEEARALGSRFFVEARPSFISSCGFGGIASIRFAISIVGLSSFGFRLVMSYAASMTPPICLIGPTKLGIASFGEKNITSLPTRVSRAV